MGMGLITVLVVPGGHVEPLRTSAEEGEDIRYDEEEEDEDATNTCMDMSCTRTSASCEMCTRPCRVGLRI